MQITKKVASPLKAAHQGTKMGKTNVVNSTARHRLLLHNGHNWSYSANMSKIEWLYPRCFFDSIPENHGISVE